MTRTRILAVALGAMQLANAPEALAQSTIRQPGNHLSYGAEIEPHVALSLVDPPGPWANGGVGLGVYGTIPVVENGFVSSINNSVGIRFGLDLLWHGTPSGYDGYVYNGYCRSWRSGPNGSVVCTDAGGYGVTSATTYAVFPVAMQWNFWLTRRWSLFGEPGLAVYAHPWGPHWGDGIGILPVFSAGGRVLLGERTALTIRLGYPSLSLGLSFLP